MDIKEKINFLLATIKKKYDKDDKKIPYSFLVKAVQTIMQKIPVNKDDKLSTYYNNISELLNIDVYGKILSELENIIIQHKEKTYQYATEYEIEHVEPKTHYVYINGMPQNAVLLSTGSASASSSSIP